MYWLVAVKYQIRINCPSHELVYGVVRHSAVCCGKTKQYAAPHYAAPQRRKCTIYIGSPNNERSNLKWSHVT